MSHSSLALATFPTGPMVALALSGLAAGCDPFGTGFKSVEGAQTYRASRLSCTEEECLEDIAARGLRVTTYNVKFGGGRIDFFFDCHGDRVLMDASEVYAHLDGLVDKIRELSPDILLLQEVDIASKRSAFVDQVQYILDNTKLNYGAYASQWRADFVPSDGLGAVDSGNAILSRLPLVDGKRIALDLRSDQSAIEQYFYLQRNLLTATVWLGAKPLYLVATHTAAFSQDGTKRKHIERFKQELDASPGLVLGGGDLNALPPGSNQLDHFDDSACVGEYEADDYREETTWLNELYEDYKPAIPLSDYQADNARYFSHTTLSSGFWNRKLDYLFTNGNFISGSGRVSQGTFADELPTMPLSDHAPLSAVLDLSEEL